MRRRLSVAVVLLFIFSSACKGSAKGSVPPYFPDDRGIVTKAAIDSIQLDGARTYQVSSFVMSFSSYSPKKLLPLLGWQNHYVHVGLDDKKAVQWIAGVGVVDKTLNPPIVYYTNGIVDKVHGTNLILKDGSVFALAGGVRVPKTTKHLTLMIDAKRHLVTRIVVQPR